MPPSRLLPLLLHALQIADQAIGGVGSATIVADDGADQYRRRLAEATRWSGKLCRRAVSLAEQSHSEARSFDAIHPCGRTAMSNAHSFQVFAGAGTAPRAISSLTSRAAPHCRLGSFGSHLPSLTYLPLVYWLEKLQR
jgi:hypothetical protein